MPIVLTDLAADPSALRTTSSLTSPQFHRRRPRRHRPHPPRAQAGGRRGAGDAGPRLEGLQQAAGLAGQRRAADIQGAQLLEGIGKAQLGERQAGLDIGYEDFLGQRNFTKDQIGFLSGILQGVPVQPDTTRALYQPYNPLQQALGAGIAGLGLYRGMM